MNKKLFEKVLGRLADDLVPTDTDLWPAIRKHFETSKDNRIQGDHSMKTNLARYQLAFAFLLALLLATTTLFVTPQGRTLAQTVMRFFNRAEVDRLPVQQWQQTPIIETPGPDPASIIDANQSVSGIEQQAGYDILEPTWLPDILAFEGASLEPERKIARIFYKYMYTNGLVLREEPLKQSEDCELCGVVGASAEIEKVQINNSPGEYVRGVWNLTEKGPVWVSDPYQQTLRWQANGMAFQLMYMGPPDTLSKADLIKIAESLK